MSEGKSVFTVRNVMRMLALLGIIFVFCPSFLVSCSGQTIKIGVMDGVGGMSMYGEEIVEPMPIMLVYLLIPIAMLVILSFKNQIEEKVAAMAVLVCAGIDMGLWFIFSYGAKMTAEENYCDFATTIWYKLNILMLLILLAFCFSVLVRKLYLETDLVAMFLGKDSQAALNQMSEKVGRMSNAVSQLAANRGNQVNRKNAIGFCQKCGAPIGYDVRFCTSCGTPVPESLIAQAEAARRAAEAEAARRAAEAQAEAVRQTAAAENRRMVKYCVNCGAKLDADAKFCMECGTKVE